MVVAEPTYEPIQQMPAASVPEPIRDPDPGWDPDATEEYTPSSVAVLTRPAEAVRVPTSDLALTNALVSELWTAEAEALPIEDWTIGEVDTESRVMARRVMIGTVLTIGVALFLAASWFVTGRADGSLESTLADLGTANSDLTVSIAGLTPALSDLSDGRLDDREAAVASAGEVDAAARALFSDAANLPTSNEFAAQRASTVALSDDAIELARDISKTTAYVAALQVMANRPDYPHSTSDTELAPVAEMTATWVTRFISMSTSLPEVSVFDSHLDQVVALADSLPAWQSAYLDALRTGNTDSAGARIGELERQVGLLEAELADDLMDASKAFESKQTTMLEALDIG